MLSTLTVAKPAGAAGAVAVMFETKLVIGIGTVEEVVINTEALALVRFIFTGADADTLPLKLAVVGGTGVIVVVVGTVVVTVDVVVTPETPLGMYIIVSVVVYV
jgi:hypothetical protein